MPKDKRHVILIAGRLGSGKTTTRKLLAEKLDYESYSSGDFFKNLAKEKGMTSKELNHMAEMYEYVDQMIDQRQKEFIENHDNFIMDSRLGFHWAPAAFKVFLELPTRTSAVRMLEDSKTNELRASETAKSVEEMMEKIKARMESERRRFQRYYGIDDHMDHKHFDLIVDTRENNPEAVVDLIVDAYHAWLRDKGRESDAMMTI